MNVRSAAPALCAAFLFGASTPLAKLLVGDTGPLLLAGLLYLGSGLGLGALLVARRLWHPEAAKEMRIPRREWPWLLGAILFGGALGPALLMRGLTQTDGATASLLLNVEGMLTAVLAWLVFKENAGRQIVLGMVAIAAGGVLLSWQPGGTSLSAGALLILAACLCWAIDNNLTRKVSTNDAMLVACLKGLVAGSCNTALAWAAGASLPGAAAVGSSLLVGFFGGAAVRRGHLPGHLAPGSEPPVLDGRRADGSGRVAARARASPARAHPRTARAFASPSSRRASPAPARLRVDRR